MCLRLCRVVLLQSSHRKLLNNLAALPSMHRAQPVSHQLLSLTFCERGVREVNQMLVQSLIIFRHDQKPHVHETRICKNEPLFFRMTFFLFLKRSRKFRPMTPWKQVMLDMIAVVEGFLVFSGIDNVVRDAVRIGRISLINENML